MDRLSTCLSISVRNATLPVSPELLHIALYSGPERPLHFDGHTAQLLRHLLSLFQRFQEGVLVLNPPTYHTPHWHFSHLSKCRRRALLTMYTSEE